MTTLTPITDPTEVARLRVKMASEEVMRLEVELFRAREQLYKNITKAYGTVKTTVLADASGLTRQRIHQIVTRKKEGE